MQWRQLTRQLQGEEMDAMSTNAYKTDIGVRGRCSEAYVPMGAKCRQVAYIKE